ncbi:partial 5-methylcytosine-specific restriction enzyme B, partial [Anaerolineae bacterium]
MQKYGDTPASAFEKVRTEIIKTAEAARSDKLDVVDSVDLGLAVKWKIAFLYQDRKAPSILPIFKLEYLQTLLNSQENKVSLLQRALLGGLGAKGILEYGDEMWGKLKAGPLLDAKPPLNQILYGPPGTGKTYATIEAALAIIDPGFLAAQKLPDDADWPARRKRRQALKQRFDELSTLGRIRFVTFHQSFSYEDFVEGLRPRTNDDKQLEYWPEDGMFKLLCDAARTHASRQQSPDIGQNPRIWKISIGRTWDIATRQYCLDHREARIGWCDTGDLKEPYTPNDYFNRLGSNERNTVLAFAQKIAVGDILVCIRSDNEISAVGVVKGQYYYQGQAPQGVPEDFCHVLPVDWIYRDLQGVSILPLNNNTRFTQKTVYELDRFKYADLLAHLEKSGAKPFQPATAHPPTRVPYVLIIDEINRGNVSRIFGELITLIESDKRDGQPEALNAQLPYSKRPFSVPDNVYLIGTMNTADRSLAALDIALRRRFSFRELPPQPELLDGVIVEDVNIGALLRVLNQRIEVLLDRDHCLGHAYFMPLCETPEPELAELGLIFRHKILPLLQEYFFEDWQRIQWVLNDHRKPDPRYCFISQ